jgi:uncharacterized SAM-binding protein YcdF (DUF218 family)
MRILLRIVVGLACAYVAGFLLFVLTLPRVKTNERADGIVALTGGDERLRSAVALLERGAAQRLLITGVHPSTTKEELRVLSHGGERFDCCTDLGYEAANTRGNAEETAEWAHDHHYQSLIVVTASYHMPRSLTEFAAAMPDERLVPYPVEPPDVDLSGWWHKPGTLHLLHGEYVKYLASFVITRFENHTQQQPLPLQDRSATKHDGSRSS